jgi:hypothetical protein
METIDETTGAIEILFTVEGRAKPFSANAGPTMTVLEFGRLAAKAGQIDEAVEVFLEDAETALAGELVLIEHLAEKFAPIHVASPGKIKTTVEYNNRRIEHDFRANSTIARVLEWAVGKNGFDLDKPAADFQLKHKGEVLSLDDHLGQVAGGHKQVALHLVFKVKPQG